MIITTRGLEECVSGVILYDETIRQSRADGMPFVKILAEAGIVPGIKVDTGAKDLAGHPGEKVTEGLDGLRDRLQNYFKMGARFAKWRAVIRTRQRPPEPALASTPTPTPWPATPPFARKPASCRSSSPKC